MSGKVFQVDGSACSKATYLLKQTKYTISQSINREKKIA